MEDCFYFKSPIGVLRITANSHAITSLTFVERIPVIENLSPNPILFDALQWLERYFNNEKPEANQLPLELKGTYFQTRVWNELLKIPYGVSVTYGQIAKAVAGTGKMSAQAVGQAVAANPINIIVPCHRVLGTNNRLTGYVWGLEKKKWLLDLEQIQHK